MSTQAQKAITRCVKSAMGSWLPRTVETSIGLMADMGLPASIFQFITPLRRIMIRETMSDTPYLGVYFGERIESTPGSEKVNWKALGWDGKPYMIMFPGYPPEWVFMHEFFHYLDDTFIQAICHYNERLVHPYSAIMETLHPRLLDEFADLHKEMEEEFKRVQWEGKRRVADKHGEAVLLSDTWYWKIPQSFVHLNAPSDYSYANLTEWKAECFQTLCVWRSYATLKKMPKTSAFMRFFLSGKIFGEAYTEILDKPVIKYRLSKAEVESLIKLPVPSVRGIGDEYRYRETTRPES